MALGVEDILDRLSDDEGAMIVRPATSKDLAQCQKDLAEMEMHALPQDYVDFLRTCNGFAWNGIQLYSTDQVTDPENDFTLNDIVSANEDFQMHHDELPEKLLLGRSDEDYYTYDTKQEVFEILDFTSCDQMEKFESFEELFVEVVQERMDDLDDDDYDDDDDIGSDEEDEE